MKHSHPVKNSHFVRLDMMIFISDSINIFTKCPRIKGGRQKNGIKNVDLLNLFKISNGKYSKPI